MQLPENLRQAVDLEIESSLHGDLQRAADRMTQQYHREGKNSTPLFSDLAGCRAYLAIRMPATYAAIHCVFKECRGGLPDFHPKSLLDFGAGPGTGCWAAAEWFDSLESIHCVEPSRLMREIGQKIARQSDRASICNARWSEDLRVESVDLALFSYVFTEMSAAACVKTLKEEWEHCQVVAVIEPGTPVGFQRILQIRDWALAQKAHLAAPCPHTEKCPMPASKWCHFPARVDRSRLHKSLKAATLGYEDEKFSYLVFGKIPAQPFFGRVVDRPQKNKGFVKIFVCAEGALQEVSVSRKNEAYRAARDIKYGDSWMQA